MNLPTTIGETLERSAIAYRLYNHCPGRTLCEAARECDIAEGHTTRGMHSKSQQAPFSRPLDTLACGSHMFVSHHGVGMPRQLPPPGNMVP